MTVPDLFKSNVSTFVKGRRGERWFDGADCLQIHLRITQRPVGLCVDVACIRAPEENRGKGNFAAHLDEIERLADAHGLIVYPDDLNERVGAFFAKRGYVVDPEPAPRLCMYRPLKAVEITEQDLPRIRGWWSDHGADVYPEGWDPPTGYWVPGVLAAFLYRTDSKVALIDGVVSNKASTAEQRRQAMFLVGGAIAARAKSEGFKWLRGLTRYPTVAENSRQAGYRVSEPTYMTMLLELETTDK
jgi:hypothetical protein